MEAFHGMKKNTPLLFPVPSQSRTFSDGETIKFVIIKTRAVQLIEFDSHAHLVSKAGSVIGAKSLSPVFKLSGS